MCPDPPEVIRIAPDRWHEIKLVGTRARGEGEPYTQEAHVTDAAMVRLFVEPETPYKA